MKPLSGLDGLFLSLETEATPMHIGELHLVDLAGSRRIDYGDKVRRAMAHRLDVAPIFHRRLAPMPLGFANPVWIEAAPDLDHHVRTIRLDPPGDLQALQDRVAELHAERLDRTRPLWMLYVFDGLDGIAPANRGGSVRALYLKAHHAALDGAAGAVLGDLLFDVSVRAAPRARPVRCHNAATPQPRVLATSAVTHAVRQVRGLAPQLPRVIGTLGRMLLTPRPGANDEGSAGRGLALGPRTPLNCRISAARGFAAASLPLDEVHAIAASTGTTINDMVLALCSETLRRYLHRHGGIPRAPLIATMPISLRSAGDTEFTTRATLSLVSLATDEPDPLRRLQRIHASSQATKAVVRSPDALVPTDFPTIGLPWLLSTAAHLYEATRITDALTPIANVIVSNVRGSERPLHFAGGRLRTYWPLSIVEHGWGLNLTVLSYAGSLEFGFTVATAAVPHPGELVDDLQAAFGRFRERVRPGRAEAGAAKQGKQARRAPRAQGKHRRTAAGDELSA